MPKQPYNTKFTVQAENADEANKTFAAIQNLIKHIPAEDLQFLGDMTAKKGNWVPKAKPYVNYL